MGCGKVGHVRAGWEMQENEAGVYHRAGEDTDGVTRDARTLEYFPLSSSQFSKGSS